ncbi:Transposon Tf2-11 polyprotein [Sesamum angolense]|uniref:Transposon Tf2-11 polyprotein n=1 Tax=Sesamum angolense TaxID=2727404 RepID=A0AAE1T7I8_9LAMI|nr:Transposon Tf2-11 polyprotein [Sesamum angolense]
MWISSIVPVRKKNGQIRVCVDFRDLNNACPKDDFSLPIVELMIDATTGHEALSFMDGSSGYNQIRMAPADEELMAFRTPKGIYCYKVMPFGLRISAPHIKGQCKGSSMTCFARMSNATLISWL